MRILCVTAAWPTTSHPWRGCFIKSQMDSIAAAGIEVEVRSILGFRNRVTYLTAAGELARSNARRDIDLVHAHYGHSGVVARMHFRAPLILSYCGDDLLGTRLPDGSISSRSRIEARLFRQLARACAATITKSSEMEHCLPAAVRGRNHVIPNGVDLDQFRAFPRERACADLGWDSRRRYVLFVGDPGIAAKNFPLAEATVRRARAHLPAIELKVVTGWPPGRVPLAMSAASAMLCTSRSEGSPNAVKEALACDLPVVATDVGDIRQRLSDLEGCAVCRSSPDDLARALLAAVEGGRLADGRESLRGLSLTAVAQRVVGVYETVLNEARPGGRG